LIIWFSLLEFKQRTEYQVLLLTQAIKDLQVSQNQTFQQVEILDILLVVLIAMQFNDPNQTREDM